MVKSMAVRASALPVLFVLLGLSSGDLLGLEVVMHRPKGVVQVFVFDEARGELPAHVGPEGDLCGDGSNRSKLLNVKWTALPVKIHFDGATLETLASGATAAAKAAFSSWDDEEHPAGAFFSEVATSSEAKVKVNGGSIDGVNGTLAVTSYSYNRFSRAFLSATVTFDTAESWGILADSCSPSGNTFDVQDVGTHEAGHVVGLGHVNDFRLTMNTFGYPGVTLHRSLGRGDQIGIDKIY